MTKPGPDSPLEDQAAWILSEILNDNAPIGWERYRFAAGCLFQNQEFRRLMAKQEGRES